MPQLTPAEEAKKLVNDFYDKIDDFPVKCGMYCQGGDIERYQLAKQSTLIAVNKILTVLDFDSVDSEPYSTKKVNEIYEHWEKVKSEIIKL